MADSTAGGVCRFADVRRNGGPGSCVEFRIAGCSFVGLVKELPVCGDWEAGSLAIEG